MARWQDYEEKQDVLQENDELIINSGGIVKRIKAKKFKGEKGEKGDTGEKGVRGPRGEKGDTGEKGEAFKFSDFTEEQLEALRGPQGIRGERGEVGPQGLQGIQGPQGLQGLRGERGVQGLQGPQGIQGPVGPAGPQGEPGPAGTGAGDMLKSENLAGLVDIAEARENLDVYSKDEIENKLQNIDISGKVDVEPGKGLSEQNFTLAEKKKLSELQNFSKDYNDLTNKPNLFSGNYEDLNNKPNLDIFVSKDGDKVLSDYNFSNTYKKKLDGIGPRFIEVTVSDDYNVRDKIGVTESGNYVPKKGDFIKVKFLKGCYVGSPTLNIDGSGAKNIRNRPHVNINSVEFDLGNNTSGANVEAIFWYDGNYYRIFGSNRNDYYSQISPAEVNTGTSTTSRAISAKLLNDWATGKFQAKEEGKGLSSNDFTNELKRKLEQLPSDFSQLGKKSPELVYDSGVINDNNSYGQTIVNHNLNISIEDFHIGRYKIFFDNGDYGSDWTRYGLVNHHYGNADSYRIGNSSWTITTNNVVYIKNGGSGTKRVKIYKFW